MPGLKANELNSFVMWAQDNNIALDMKAYESRKQLLSYEDIEDKKYFNKMLPKEERESKAVTVTKETLIDDAATVYLLATAGDKVKRLGKYGIPYLWGTSDNCFFTSCQRARVGLYENLAIGFMLSNLATWTVIFDRNADKGYLVTTTDAWESFKKTYADTLADTRARLAKAEADTKKASEERQKAAEKARKTAALLRHLENKEMAQADFIETYKKFD